MNTSLINTGLRYTGRIPSTGRDVAIAGLAVLSLIALSACNDDDAVQALSDRPSVTFTATDTELTVPAQVPAGFVDIELETAPGDVGHHLVIARLNDGVALDGERRGQAPDSEGTVRLGPGMVISVPDEFDATGTWEFVNDDPVEPHEAALVQDGITHLGQGMVTQVRVDG